MKINTPLNEFNRIEFINPIAKEYISVIIPVYNDVKGLEVTIKSLKKQSLASNKFEIIIANDGGDIQISALCKKFQIKEIKIIPNLGSYNARNSALKESKGEFIAFTDADVITDSTWLENGLKALRNSDYIAGQVQHIPTKTKTIIQKYSIFWEFNIDYLLNKEHYGVTANLFIKRKIIEDIGGFDNRLKSGGDNEFGNRVHFYIKYIQKFDSQVKVYHPFRDYNEIIVKKKRVYQGINDLLLFYPERYKQNMFSSYFDMFIYTIKPPTEYIKDFKFFLFIWWQNIINFILIVRYINNIPLLQKNNRFNNFINKFLLNEK